MSLAVAEQGIKVVSKDYSLTQNGMDVFASWTLDQGSEAAPWSMGMRNSMQKFFAIGICAGLRITVCSNLSFDGEFLEFRKHTSGLDIEELIRLSRTAVNNMTQRLKGYGDWQEGLRDITLPEDHFKVLTHNAIVEDVLPASKFHDFRKHYDEELEVNKSNGTLYDFHGAGTRVMRNASLFQVSDRSKILNRVIEDYRPELLN
jgi:hypothetical protein